MKIALIGATGFVGSAILREALDRGHAVTAIQRNPEKLTVKEDGLSVVRGDVMQTKRLAEILEGNDVVVSAYNSGWTNPDIYRDYLKGAQSIRDGVKDAGIRRLIVIGGAGSLYISPGVQLIDTAEFPEEWKPGASAARDYLYILGKEAELDWTFLSPAIEMHQGTSGERKGTYRTGLENPVFDENNRSVISVEDLAVAVVDELEKPSHIRERFTVAY